MVGELREWTRGDQELATALLSCSWLLADLARELDGYGPERLAAAVGLLDDAVGLLRSRKRTLVGSALIPAFRLRRTAVPIPVALAVPAPGELRRFDCGGAS